MPYELSETVKRALREELVHVEREVLAEFAHLPESTEFLKRRRWLAGYVKELDRVLGIVGRTEVGLAERLAKKLPVKQVYTEAAKDAAAQLHVSAPRIPVRAVEFLEENGLQNMRKLARDVRESLEQQVRAGIVRNEGTRQIAKRLTLARAPRGRGRVPGRLGRGVFPSVKARAELIAQDQLAHVHIQGRGLTYADEGVERVELIRKPTACEVCMALPKTMTLEAALSSLPAHPRCMCDFAAVRRRGVELR